MSTELEPVPVDVSPLALYRMALDKGLDPDKLGKLLDLHERIEDRRAEQAFNAALVACQADVGALVKTRENQHTRSKFAALEDVLTLAQPALTKHGFAPSWSGPVPCVPHREGWVHLTLDLSHAEGHTRRYEADYPLDGTGSQGGKSAMNAIQGTGSTVTYARRYMLVGALNIRTVGEDFDGNLLSGVITPEQTQEINELLEECEQLGRAVEMPRFLKWIGAESLRDIRQADFAKVIHELNRARRKAMEARAS